jgi:hypothetical protein
MNRSETATLLALAAARDRRTIGETDVLAWTEDLGDIAFVEARAALTRHFRTSTKYLMPAHIVEIVRDIRADAQRYDPHPIRAIASRFEPDPDRAARAAAGVAACRAAFTAPEKVLDPDDPRRDRALRQAREERGLPTPLPPKPKRRDQKSTGYPKPTSDEIAAMATRYLVDGYTPADVSDRLGISRKWCEKTAAKFTASTP